MVVRQVTADPVGAGETVYLVVEPRHRVLLEDERRGLLNEGGPPED